MIPRDNRPAGAENIGGLIVASWVAFDRDRSRSRPPSVSAWVVPEPGLPTVGASRQTKQISFAECVTGNRPTRRARVTVFTLVTGTDTTAYLAATWPLGNGRHLQLAASAPRIAQLNPVRRSLLDALTEPPADR